jgi:hypothetical protein
MNLIPSYPNGQRDLVAAVLSNLSCPELIYEEFVSDEEDDAEGNLLETLNVIADSKRFYEGEYADVVERLYHTEKAVFHEYIHTDTIWTENHLVSDSEFFIPYALANLLEGMTDQGSKSELRLSDEDLEDLWNLRQEIKGRAREALLENLNDRRIRENNIYNNFRGYRKNELSLAATRLQRKKEESSQEEFSQEDIFDEEHYDG